MLGPGMTVSAYVTVVEAEQSSVAAGVPVWLGSVAPLAHWTVTLLTQASEGATVSTVVIVWDAVTVLPHASTAVHVRVITFGQVAADTVCVYVSVAVVHTSVAVTAAGGGTGCVQGMTTLDGTPPSTGAALSTTVIVCVAEALLPQASVAVHVRVITFGQVADEVLSLYAMTGEASQPSVAVAEPVWAGAVELPHETVASAGAATTGAVVSRTVMVWLTGTA